MVDHSATVAEQLAARAGDAMALNDRFLNPQLGRIVRTLGFDRVWVRGEGAHLIDADGTRYLDLLSGYGTFAIGRNHPDVVAALHGLLDAHSANLPQLGVSVLPGLLAEALVTRSPARIAAIRPGERATSASASSPGSTLTPSWGRLALCASSRPCRAATTSGWLRPIAKVP